MKVVKLGEDAFEAQCLITLPNGVDYVRTKGMMCRHNKSVNYDKETQVVCDIGNPMVANDTVCYFL